MSSVPSLRMLPPIGSGFRAEGDSSLASERTVRLDSLESQRVGRSGKAARGKKEQKQEKDQQENEEAEDAAGLKEPRWDQLTSMKLSARRDSLDDEGSDDNEYEDEAEEQNEDDDDDSVRNLGVYAKWKALEDRHRQRMDSRQERMNAPIDECRETFEEIIHMFPVFGPILENIKAEYECYISAGENAQRNAHMIQLELDTLDKSEEQLEEEVQMEKQRIEQLKLHNDELRSNLQKLEMELEMQRLQEESSRHVFTKADIVAKESEWMEISHLEEQIKSYKKQILEIRDQLKSRYVPLALKSWLEENVRESQREMEKLQDILSRKDDEVGMLKSNIARLNQKLAGFDDHPSMRDGTFERASDGRIVSRRNLVSRGQTMPTGLRMSRDGAQFDGPRPPPEPRNDRNRYGGARKQSIGVSGQYAARATSRGDQFAQTREMSEEHELNQQFPKPPARSTYKPKVASKIWPIIHTIQFLDKTRRMSKSRKSEKDG